MLEKDIITVLKFNTEKGLHHFLETLKSFNFEKWLHHILMTLKVFQNSYSVECWWTAALKAAYYIIFMINELDLLWVHNFIVWEIYFLFGIKFCLNEGIDTCFNVKCVLLGGNLIFLVVTTCYLVVTTRYWWLLLVTARSHF